MPDNLPAPRYSLWQAISTSLAVGLRALEEVRALPRERGEPGECGERGTEGPAGPPGAIGEKGDPGEPAYPGRACGLWNEAESYRAMDVVALNGSEWRAVYDNPGPLPGPGWKEGARGVRGKSGERGATGDKGERGPPGVVEKHVVDVLLRLDDYQFVAVYSDGSKKVLDMQPLIERYYQENVA